MPLIFKCEIPSYFNPSRPPLKLRGGEGGVTTMRETAAAGMTAGGDPC